MVTWIKNGNVIDPANGTDGILDICIEDGVIKKVGKGIAKGSDAIDAEGLVVSPGLVDMHCHLREPGFEYKEDIASGTKSAAAGGFTSVACMPNTSPAIDSAAVAAFVQQKAKMANSSNVYVIGAISKGLKGEELAPIGEMKEAGVVAVSDDGKPVSNAALMRHALVYAGMFDMPVISHCEDLSLLEGGSMNEGLTATMLGLRGISPAVEEVMVARDILIAEADNTRVHIAHVSTRGSVELVRQAKRRGVRVTCETCPHYFSLTEKAVEGFDTNAKMNPPLRSEDDVKAIIEGLCDGTIDAIATDHAPHHIDEKQLEFDKAANGIVGFETALSLAITYLVKPGHLTLSQVIEKMSSNPSKILGIGRGTLSVGAPADILIFDPQKKRTINTQKFLSKSKNSPYDGYKLFGATKYTIVGGRVVFKA